MSVNNYLVVEYIPNVGETLCAGSEPFDCYAEALNWLVDYNNLLAEEKSYDVEPVSSNGHFFYRPARPAGDDPSRAVWIEPVDP